MSSAFAIALFAFFSICLPVQAMGQSIINEGSSTEFYTGKNGMESGLYVQKARSQFWTDEPGQYRLHRPVSGEYTLNIPFRRYHPTETTAPDQTLAGNNEDEELQQDLFSGNQQSNRHLFSQIITAEQLQMFGDRNIEEAMARIVGVQADRQGRINLRGIGGAGRGLYNVSIDGQRLATTGKGNRSIDLANISTDMVSRLEVRKVLTPDQDADAIGGLINIQTSRPVPHQRTFNVLYGGGFHSGYGEFLNPDSRAVVQYSETISDNIAISAGVTRQHNNFAWERLGVGFEVADFGSGETDVIESISPSLHTQGQNNLGGRFELLYRPDNVTRMFVNTFFTSSSMNMNEHRLTKSANGDWSSQSETGETGRQGEFGYDMILQEQHIAQVISRAGAQHRLNFMDLQYSVGWSHGRLQEDQVSIPFLMRGLDYTINMNDRTRPTMQAINGQISSSDLRINPMNEIAQDHTDNNFTGNIDLDIPVGPASLRFGSGAQLRYKNGDFRDTMFEVLGAMFLSRFQMEPDRTFTVLDRSAYEIPWYIKPENARSYFDRNQPVFRRNDQLQPMNSDIWNYRAFEGVYSGYGMAEMDIGLLNITSGIRVEHTAARYDGNNVRFNDIGFHASTDDTSTTESYTHFFPNLQLGIEPSASSRLRLAYSRSIARHNYHYLTPFHLVHEMDETLFRGNPALQPMTSDNLDLMLEQGFGSGNYVGVGMFYKNISNFVFERIRTVEDGPWQGFEERTFDTGDEMAEVYGVEINLQQHLGFLPGIAGNFGTFANYTWTQSRFDTGFRDDEVRLPGQSPHVVNAALNYRQGRFYGQVAYHWTSDAIVHLAETPMASVSGPVYRDRYEDGAWDVSASMRIRITENFRLWADASNLIGRERVQYFQSRSAYPYETYLRGSSAFRVGLRFDM